MVRAIPEVVKCVVNNNNIDKNIDLSNNQIRYNISQLSHILQLSLDSKKTLQSFFKFIKHNLKLTNLLYINNYQDLQIQLGTRISALKSHSKNIVTYDLYYKKESLGELTIASKTFLSSAKLCELKSYIKLLILPLKNSLLYNKALKETKTDPLTKIANKVALYDDINYHFNLANRCNNNLSVIFLDIDFFKKINDKHGHLVGDNILIELADLIKAIIRKSDILYRFGGEEFVILLENTNQDGAINLAQKIKKYTNKYMFQINTIQNNIKNNINLKITVSSGIATKQSKDTVDSLLKRADKALYKAKANGRNRYHAS